jgi:uncharacterized membrane-anchored protein YhcB (DUF1043 family)
MILFSIGIIVGIAIGVVLALIVARQIAETIPDRADYDEDAYLYAMQGRPEDN